jgi:3-oxoacyl-(acyl-carrier-protein) synthase
VRGVAITGLGIVSALGSGVAAHLEAMREGRTGLRPLTLFSPEDLGSLPVGEVDAGLVSRSRGPRCIRLALHAARQALGLRTFEDRGLLALGTTTGGILESERHFLKHRGAVGAEDRGLLLHHPVGTVTGVLGRALGLSAEEHTFSTACSSSANAIGFGAATVAQRGGWALVGGVDSLSRLTYAGFHALRLLSSAPCRPFDRHRRGLSLGEGAAFLLLESEEQARQCGAPVLGFITGWGCASDAHHATAPHPRGDGAVAAIQGALADAGLHPADVDYVNAHGTATPANDVAEGLALERVFGAHCPLTSSTKGLTGHTLGAAGAIEIVLSLIALSSDFVPATTGLEEADPEIHIRHVPPGGLARPLSVVVSNSFGFGGNNTALVLSRAAA